jgi:hypothetical protein
MTKKLLAAALTIAACAALWDAVCPQNTSDGKIPAADQVTNTAAVVQEEHTGAIPLSAAEKEYAQSEETSPPLPTEAPEPAPVMAETQPPRSSAERNGSTGIKAHPDVRAYNGRSLNTPS